jgi:hypothetical protein
MHRPDEPAGHEASGLLNEVRESAFQSSLLALHLFLEASEKGADPSAVSAAQEAGRLATQCGAAAEEAVLLVGEPENPTSGPPVDAGTSGRLRRLNQRARVEANLVCEIAAGVTPTRERSHTITKENIS